MPWISEKFRNRKTGNVIQPNNFGKDEYLWLICFKNVLFGQDVAIV